MYGQIHQCVRLLVQEKFGEDIWQKVLKAAEFDVNEHFLVFHRYPDTLTLRLIGCVCTVLEAPLPTVLEIFGEFFLLFCMRHGYDKMLQTLGGDFKSFIQNLDSLHSLLALTYTDIEAPSFRCEINEDQSLTLHYYTIRPGLHPIVLGLVKAVARDLYDQGADITLEEVTSEDIEGGKRQEHAQFRVFLFNKNPTKKGKEIVALKEFVPVFPKGFTISSEQFCYAFPYHLIFDEHLRIIQSGMSIQKLSGITMTGKEMKQIFELIHPRMEMKIKFLRMFINSVFMLKVKIMDQKHKTLSGKTLILKGQMMWMEDINHMIFISSPRLGSLNDMMEMNVYLADIPIYDVTRELVLLNQQRLAEIDIAKKLDETTTELRKISDALDVEKKKTEELLYQMLPEKVADSLKNGKEVDSEKFDQVSVLFSDIVTFTNIAAACPPMAVVNMLNDMYNRFDHLTNLHGVYKVETIGDAYMIVCGVPVKTNFHAQPVANFAIDMVENAAQVMSPATGKPLQIRVGIHTGPVVAGVVGKKMPRYCLFGDTVNTASRMESHGCPGRVHISPTTYDHLKLAEKYVFRCRGDIEVKGKGRMTTFWLMGTLSHQLFEPDDEHVDLPLINPHDHVQDITYPKAVKKIGQKSGTCVVL